VRLFVAVELAPAIAHALAAFEGDLQRRITALFPQARLTWVPAERLHLTVRFIGEVDDAANIAAALSPPLATRAFEVEFTGAGAFPARGTPRVLWAGVSKGVDELTALEQEVSERLLGAGVAREDRPYRPHLTLARVREGSRLKAAPLFDGIANTRFGAMPADAITLFHSKLSPKGPTYVALQRTALHTWKTSSP
jgi:2'-5' RNA ligase